MGFIYLLYHLCRKWILSFMEIFMIYTNIKKCRKRHSATCYEVYCCCSVTQSIPILRNPVDCSMPGHSVSHHLPEFVQVHVHCIGDAVQRSHPLTPSSTSALTLPQSQGLFQWVDCLHQMNKILELQLQHQSSHWVNIQGWFPLRLTGLTSLLSKGLSGVFSSTTVQRY